MTSPQNLRLEPRLAIICGLMRGLEEGQEYRHSQPEGGVRAPQYVEISEDVNHQCKINPELQALGYEYQWQRKPWRVWGDIRYVPACSPDLHEEDRLLDEPTTPSRPAGATTPEPPAWGTYSRSPEDPRPSPSCCA